ncbi:MAG: ABC transporter [Planctomycetaceae bacterium]|nr:ABC transporter [Planctomycetaceae bacterium]
MNAKVLLAVFKRNFIAYFTSPTGYVFICVFVLLSSVAAFLPDEFFNRNLANLDQLNQWFPFIMLVFVPAITMGIWAEERRQGTDELLLTIPASDFDVVLGKYLAAVAIYTVSLGFSMICNAVVLNTLGRPDAGLFAGTYVGYWFVGLAMLAVGMVASFVTSNLTIAYILGALFNAPLIVLVWAGSILPEAAGSMLREWSIGEQLNEFGRGILSFSHLFYFVTLIAVMLYLSMVFISARHWRAGASSASHLVLYGVQIVALLAIGLNLCILFARYDVRADVTSEQLSSLAPETVKLLRNLEPKQPVQIEAFISPEVPETYVQTRLDILNRLREMKARAGSKVILRVIPTKQFSEEAARAEQRYGIQPRRVFSTKRGRFTEDNIFLGVAVTSGLEKVILPFIDRGIPVEYELARSLAIVTQQERKKVGVLKTDAELFGQMNMQTMGSSPNWPIIDELQKQYEVVEVDPSAPIEERYDVLLAVQPSSLTPETMENFLAVVRSGQPTAIFEDPFPLFAGNVPGTTAPKRPPGGPQAMMMGQRPEPKGDITPLWSLLGVDFGGDNVVWQNYNPYPKLSSLYEEFVFVDQGEDKAAKPFNETDVVTSGLQQLLFVFPGSVSGLNASKMKFDVLVETGTKTGTVEVNQIAPMAMFGMMQISDDRQQVPTGRPYVLAARIQGDLPADPKSEGGNGDDDAKDKSGEDAEKNADDKSDGEAEKKDGGTAAPEVKKLDVILVGDIDMLHRAFFSLREQGDNPEAGLDLRFDNVTFVLNVLDSLAGDDRFIEIRKRRPVHRTLTAIERATEDSRKKSAREADRLQKEYDDVVKSEQKKLDDKIKALEERMKKDKMGSQDVLLQVAMAQQAGQKRLDAEKERLKAEMEREQNQIDTKMNLEIERVQDTYKLWAVLLPPILPLLIAVFVFISRRLQEKEGVARSRLR